MKKKPDESKAKGGRARAKALPPEERKEIARKAAESRWSADLPEATHVGNFDLGGNIITAAVLPNGKRLLTQGTFLIALGRSRTPKAGTGVLGSVDGIPSFLVAKELKPYVSEELVASTTPIFYRHQGRRMVGYDAELLPNVAEAYLRMRDGYLAEGKKPPGNLKHIVRACDLLMRALAHVGIIALVDEATGYQYHRLRRDLQRILEQYVSKELAKWTCAFQADFYKHIYRLKGWQYDPNSSRRTHAIAQVTVDLTYDRIHPELVKELKQVRSEKKKENTKLHQWLTTEPTTGGHPRLKQHVEGVTALLSVADNWTQFEEWVDKRYPSFKKTKILPWPDDEVVIDGTATPASSNAPALPSPQSPSAS